MTEAERIILRGLIDAAKRAKLTRLPSDRCTPSAEPVRLIRLQKQGSRKHPMSE